MELYMETLSVTSLRQHIYKVIDKVVNTGIPQYVIKNGHRVKISLDEPKDKLANIKTENIIIGNPDELVNLELYEWNGKNQI